MQASWTMRAAFRRVARFIGVIAAAAIISAPAASAQSSNAFGQYAPAPAYSGTVTTSLYVPMRDGVRLAMSITRPAINGEAAPGRFPVIWQHTLGIAGAGADGGPIGTGPRALGYGGVPDLARHGYVTVQVARRGHGPSFGRRRGYNDRTEAGDAYEIIDWLAAQPWSTGDIGVYGCSNTGDAAMHAITAGNPHLKAAWAGCFSWEKYEGFLRGGIFANWGTGPERTIAQDMTSTPVQGDESKTLLRQAAEEHQGATVLAAMWRAMPFRDSWADGPMSRFWYEGSAATYLAQLQRSGTALYVQGGWYDDLRSQGLVAHANMPGQNHVIIGPWHHCASPDFNLVSEMLRFFDWKLKGKDTGMGSDDPIHYFTMNAPAGKEWRSSKIWPLAGTVNTTFYLDPAKGLAAAAPRGAKGGKGFTVRYDVDCPAERARTNEYMTGAHPCPQEHAGPHYATAPLKADTEVTGDAIADLWITSTATDANIFVYLEDVAPDGTVTSITDARLKASLRKADAPPYNNLGLPWHRSHIEDAQALVPGEPARLTINFLPASWIFRKGHRIRISVAGADYRERDMQKFDPAPVVTILNTKDHPSKVVVPVILK